MYQAIVLSVICRLRRAPLSAAEVRFARSLFHINHAYVMASFKILFFWVWLFGLTKGQIWPGGINKLSSRHALHLMSFRNLKNDCKATLASSSSPPYSTCELWCIMHRAIILVEYKHYNILAMVAHSIYNTNAYTHYMPCSSLHGLLCLLIIRCYPKKARQVLYCLFIKSP